MVRHQRTEILPNKAKRKQFQNNRSRSKNMRYSNEANQQQAPYKKKEFENKKALNPRQILQSEDRCHKCGDSKHIEGFQCSAHKYQCRNCHKFSHFSSLCYKKLRILKEEAKITQNIPVDQWQIIYTRIIPYAATPVIINQVMNLSVCK